MPAIYGFQREHAATPLKALKQSLRWALTGG
jgi:hypothetical protein